ncbi:MAG: dihydrofolate reductase, partial [Pseudomonadota bacterium]
GVIGRGGELPWRIPADMKHFKTTTMGKPVVMGRKTYESIGRPLPGRANIVISRRADFSPDGVRVARDLLRGLTLAKAVALAEKASEIAVIGGGEIYAAVLPLADRIYLTEILDDVDGDTRFPALDRSMWVETQSTPCPEDARATHACRFAVLERRNVE